MTLRKDILEFSSDEFVKHVTRMIHLHGRHVTIKSVLDWDLAADFMTKFRCLKTLTQVLSKHELDDSKNAISDGRIGPPPL
jgi:hypothetical protein